MGSSKVERPGLPPAAANDGASACDQRPASGRKGALSPALQSLREQLADSLYSRPPQAASREHPPRHALDAESGMPMSSTDIGLPGQEAMVGTEQVTSSLSSQLRLGSRQGIFGQAREISCGEEGAAKPAIKQPWLSYKTSSSTTAQDGSQQHSSRNEAAAKDNVQASDRLPAKAASVDVGELKPGPVFVPIVLTMDESDHELLVEEWQASISVCFPCLPIPCCILKLYIGHIDVVLGSALNTWSL